RSTRGYTSVVGIPQRYGCSRSARFDAQLSLIEQRCNKQSPAQTPPFGENWARLGAKLCILPATKVSGFSYIPLCKPCKYLLAGKLLVSSPGEHEATHTQYANVCSFAPDQ